MVIEGLVLKSTLRMQGRIQPSNLLRSIGKISMRQGVRLDEAKILRICLLA